MKTSLNAMLKAGRMIGESEGKARRIAKRYLELALLRCEEEQPSIESTIAAYSLGFQQGSEARVAKRLGGK